MAKSKVEYWLTEEGLTLLKGWARDGLTDKQIADKMHISTSTLYNWKNAHLEILESLKENKEIADYEVAGALYESTKDRYITVKTPIKVREEVVNEQGVKKVRERIEIVDKQIFVPASTTAQIYWLNNRQPNVWRQKHKTELEKIEAETELTKAKTTILNSGEDNPAVETLTAILKELRNNATNEKAE